MKNYTLLFISIIILLFCLIAGCQDLLDRPKNKNIKLYGIKIQSSGDIDTSENFKIGDCVPRNIPCHLINPDGHYTVSYCLVCDNFPESKIYYPTVELIGLSPTPKSNSPTFVEYLNCAGDSSTYPVAYNIELDGTPIGDSIAFRVKAYTTSNHSGPPSIDTTFKYSVCSSNK